MNLREFTPAELSAWYELELKEAFLPEEIKPLDYMRKLMEEGRYEILGAFDDTNRLVGYATFFKQEGVDLVLLDYLGVSASLRNSGIGGKLLGLIGKRYENIPMVLESELPIPNDSEEENSIRRRRIGFYTRNGFRPVYEMATCGLRWQAMIMSKKSYDLDQVMKNHKNLYGAERTDVKVPLGPLEVPEKPYWIK